MKKLCSRREADQYIEKGWVKVDGKVVSQLGSKVKQTAKITLLDQALQSQDNKVTVLLNKPIGYVSGTPEKGYKAASTLIISANQFKKNPKQPVKSTRIHLPSLAPAGRLDIDSQGLLVLTQNGTIASKLISPNSTIEKEYLLRFKGEITNEKLELLRFGLKLDGKALKRAKIKQINNEQLQFILTQGRKRQIRRMCDQVDLQVKKLQRVRIGQIRLANLPLGQWRFLAHHESF